MSIHVNRRQKMKNRKLTKAILAVVAIAALATTAFAQDFEPKYVGGYPTKETAERMFEEYDYQAAVQFYLWGYTYLNSLGMTKGFAKMGGDERSIYIFNKRIQPQHMFPTANSAVISMQYVQVGLIKVLTSSRGTEMRCELV